MFGNFTEFAGRNLERTGNRNNLSASATGSSFLNKPNFRTDTPHDIHGCVGGKYSLETLIGG